MAQLIYARQALDDLERITDFLLASEPRIASSTLALIVEAVEVLQNHPLIGRAATKELRELVISRGKTGYVALYSFEEQYNTVLILAIHYQREAGYSEESQTL